MENSNFTNLFMKFLQFIAGFKKNEIGCMNSKLYLLK